MSNVCDSYNTMFQDLPNKCQDLIQDRRFPDSDETRTSVNRIRHFNKNNLK